MGVPGFVPWLTQRYTGIITRSHPEPVFGLYVDVSGVIHPMCHGEGADDLSEEEKFQSIQSFLDNLIRLLKPTGILYLATDGVAPSAKMSQQRARRYMAKAYLVNADEDPSLSTEPQRSTFDSNSISPGTEFMDRLCRALELFIQKKLTENDSLWKRLCVILSDSNVPSEGEHKLIRFLRAQSSSPKFFEKPHVVVGLDADLIFLCLSLHVPNLFIMRQVDDYGRNCHAGSGDSFLIPNMKKSFKFEYLNVEAVGNSLIADIYQICEVKHFRCSQIKNFSSESASGFSFDSPKSEIRDGSQCGAVFHPCTCSFNSKVIDDFIVLGFLIGNDFMPRLPSAYCKERALDHLLECYVDDVLPYGFLTMPCGRLNMHQLCRLFSSYNLYYETNLFIQAQPQNNKPKNAKENKKCFEFIKKTYYDSIGILDGTTLDRYCQAYLDTMQFVWKYYSTLLPVNWEWCYRYHYAPLATDLASFLIKKKYVFVPDASFSVASEPCDKFVQLLSILPPSSAVLLPPSCRLFLKCSPDNPEIPSEWEVDFTGALSTTHLAKPLIPFVDRKKVKQLFTSIQHELTPSEITLNENQKYHLIYYNKEVADRNMELSKKKQYQNENQKGGENESTEGECSSSTLSSPHVPLSFVGERSSKISLCDGKVQCDLYLEHSDPSCLPKPRQYSLSAQKSFSLIPGINTFSHSVHSKTGCELVEFMVFSSTFYVCVHQLLFGFSFFLFTQLLCIFFTVLLFLYFFHFASHTIPTRNNVKSNATSSRSFSNWLCYQCNEMNFISRSNCFFCGYPFIPSRCKLLYTGKNKELFDLLFDPNHKNYYRLYRGLEQNEGNRLEVGLP